MQFFVFFFLYTSTHVHICPGTGDRATSINSSSIVRFIQFIKNSIEIIILFVTAQLHTVSSICILDTELFFNFTKLLLENVVCGARLHVVQRLLLEIHISSLQFFLHTHFSYSQHIRVSYNSTPPAYNRSSTQTVSNVWTFFHFNKSTDLDRLYIERTE